MGALRANVVDAAKDLIAFNDHRGKQITYLSVKRSLIELFGEEEVEAFKGEVSALLRCAAACTDAAPVRSNFLNGHC